MALVVLGLSHDGGADAVRAGLTAAGLPLDPLQVIESDDSDQPMARGIAGADILTSDRGMSVPGINTGPTTQQFFRNESLSDRLGDLGIPESELDNYVEALERGKCVVAYFTKPETADRVAEIFRGANLANVREY